MQIKKNIVTLLVIVSGTVLSLVPFVISPVCPVMKNGMYMSCRYSGLLVMTLGIIIAITGFAGMFIKNKFVLTALNFIAASSSLSAHLIPHKIIKIPFGVNKEGMPRFFGFCGRATMECVKHNTFTIASIVAFIILILSLGNIIYLFIKKDYPVFKNIKTTGSK